MPGNDLRAEAARLILVSRAFQHSPIVPRIAGRVNGTAEQAGRQESLPSDRVPPPHARWRCLTKAPVIGPAGGNGWGWSPDCSWISEASVSASCSSCVVYMLRPRTSWTNRLSTSGTSMLTSLSQTWWRRGNPAACAPPCAGRYGSRGRASSLARRVCRRPRYLSTDHTGCRGLS